MLEQCLMSRPAAVGVVEVLNYVGAAHRRGIADEQRPQIEFEEIPKNREAKSAEADEENVRTSVGRVAVTAWPNRFPSWSLRCLLSDRALPCDEMATTKAAQDSAHLVCIEPCAAGNFLGITCPVEQFEQ